jgi:hypothetical protein
VSAVEASANVCAGYSRRRIEVLTTENVSAVEDVRAGESLIPANGLVRKDVDKVECRQRARRRDDRGEIYRAAGA